MCKRGIVVGKMTEEDKVAKFDEIQKYLWDMALHGNMMQSTLGAAIIRNLSIYGPNGEDPDDA